MIKEEKIKAVEKLKEELEKTAVIGIVDMHKMPSKQLQEVRKSLRGKGKLIVIKKVILKFAIDSVKKEKIKDIETVMPAQPAIILTDMDAFKLYTFVDKLRFKTFAKDGDVADEDIWVSAGPTSLMAGPVISELQQAGVAASIEGGKIKIRKDACIVKAGEPISVVKAGVLRKLKIEPMEIVLNIVGIYENGDIYHKDILNLTAEYPQMLLHAFNNALNLSVSIVFPTKENIKYLLAKANRAANAINALIGVEKKEDVVEEVKKDSNDVKETEEKEGDKPKDEAPTENGGVK